MAISINWSTKVISIPQSYMTNMGGGVYELDTDQFRLDLKNLEDSDEGMPFPTTHNHVAPISLGGITLGRVIEIINGYTITFEDLQYAVNLVGSNNNISDVSNVNQVSIRSSNSAGLIQVSGGGGGGWTDPIEGGRTAAELLRLLVAVSAGKTYVVNNPDGSKTIKFRDLDDTKDRVGATVIESERSGIILDLT